MAEANRLFVETAFRGALASGTLRDPTWRSIKVAYAFAYAAMTWLLVVGLLGFCIERLSRPNAWIRYLMDSSYWVYLVHQPLILLVALQLCTSDLDPIVKYVIVVCSAFSIPLVSYDLLVRSTPIGAVLNGRRHPTAWSELLVRWGRSKRPSAQGTGNGV
jgi:hypothetical protein